MALGLFVSNNAAVLIMMGLVKSLVRQLDLHLKKCVLVLIYCCNLSFATPFSYQTNLMVQEVGGYAFMDYVRFGFPMQLFLMVVTLASCELLDFFNIYPFNY